MPQTHDPLATYRFTQARPADGWLISEWAAGQSTITDWRPEHVRTAADGATEVILDRAPAGSSEPFAGGEIRSDESATVGTWSWTAQAPVMVDGAVFGLFAYMANPAEQPWLEFDLEWVGADTTEVHLAVHMVDAAGDHITNLEPVVIDLGFDAAAGFHTYEVTLTGTGAVFRADGRVIAYFSGADMPGGVWNTGPLDSYVDLWATDGRYEEWAGYWTDPGVPLVGRIADAEVRPDDLGGAMPVLGAAGADTLYGTSEDDVMDGLAGDDTLIAGEGDDRMMGGDGDDILSLWTGDDWMDGGGGSDWIRVANAMDATVDLGNWWGSQATNRGMDSIRNVENAQGNAGDDKLSGGDGPNMLQGQAGDDWLDGRAGEDQLTGGLGRDNMAGGADRDRDVFIFEAAGESAAGETRDTVQQFVGGIEEIDLRGIDARADLAGDQAFAWGGVEAGAHAAWYEVSGSNLYLKADATGDGKADLEVQVLGLSGLSEHDLLL